MDLGDVQIYQGGTFKRYRDAKVGLLTHGLNYGTGCFEGIRGYWNAGEKQLYFFRLAEHYDRMRASAKLLLIKLPESTKALCDRTVELAQRNDYRQDVYVRPIAFKAAEEIGVRLHNVKDDFAIVAVPHTSYFDSTQGLKVCVASWRRIDDNSAPARAKLTGIYVSSALAKTEAVTNGFDEAILLSADGHVSEGSAENIFVVRNGTVFTPPVTDSILEGITRDTLIELCRSELGIDVVERSIDRSELYAADEIFFSGTAVGVGPVVEVDRRIIGSGAIGKIAGALSDAYRDASLGKLAKYRHWVTPCFPSLVPSI
ncbi:MAG TPA: branched-chain amino acid transaminase [Candidatus Eremiobacteraceae bacterium]|nr:branched-chain amino acid transaminase [Candidatus Eremiobacteraceae bacterium]